MKKKNIVCSIYDNKSTNNLLLPSDLERVVFESENKHGILFVKIDSREYLVVASHISVLKKAVHSVDLVPREKKDFVIKRKKLGFTFYSSAMGKFNVLNHVVNAKDVSLGEIEQIGTSIDIEKYRKSKEHCILKAKDISSKFMETDLVEIL